MNWTQDAIADMGARMGLTGWRLNSHGVAQIQFSNGAMLVVEPGTDEVLVYLVQGVPHAAPAEWLDALKRCHARRRGAWPIQVGRLANAGGGTDIVMLTRMPERTLTPQRLEEAVLGVMRWRDDWVSRSKA